MCGIAGLVHVDSQRGGLDSDVAHAAVARMVAELQHRGPDGSGVKVVAARSADVQGALAVLGHTRLAILDLSSAGSQPMLSPDQRLGITFNGEIYNFKQLRDELGPADWRSQSDTEVILHAYARWGTTCVEHLDGMFAFA